MLAHHQLTELGYRVGAYAFTYLPPKVLALIAPAPKPTPRRTPARAPASTRTVTIPTGAPVSGVAERPVPGAVIIILTSLALMSFVHWAGRKLIPRWNKWDNYVRAIIGILGIAIPATTLPVVGDLIKIIATLLDVFTAGTGWHTIVFFGYGIVTIVLFLIGFYAVVNRWSLAAILWLTIFGGVLLPGKPLGSERLNVVRQQHRPQHVRRLPERVPLHAAAPSAAELRWLSLYVPDPDHHR